MSETPRAPVWWMIARVLIGLATAATATHPAFAEPFRIALIEDRGSSRSTETQHAEQGFRLGLEYETKGAMRVRGRAIEIATMNGGNDPETAAKLLAKIYRDNEIDVAVTTSSSAVVTAMLPVAKAFKRILLVAHAGADAITADGSNRYVFRTAHNDSQDALASVIAFGLPELNLSVVAQDNADGHGAVAALKEALQRLDRGVFLISSYFIRADGTNVGEAVSSQFDAFHDLHGAKTLLTIWPDAHPPIDQIAASNPGRFGIRLALSGEIEPNLRLSGSHAEIEGVTSYFHSLPRNPINDWLVSTWRERFHEYPDSAAAEGMSAALAVATALAKARSMRTEDVIKAMEGLAFETPKGRMRLRQEDHQALQAMYRFRIEPGTSSDTPALVREIAAAEIPLPIQNKKK